MNKKPVEIPEVSHGTEQPYDTDDDEVCQCEQCTKARKEKETSS